MSLVQRETTKPIELLGIPNQFSSPPDRLQCQRKYRHRISQCLRNVSIPQSLHMTAVWIIK